MKPHEGNGATVTARDWIQHAESDLRMARLGMNDAMILSEQVCFHAQQAAEKALKAVLLHRAVDFSFTHNIMALVDLAAENGIQMPADISQSADFYALCR